LNKEAYFSHQYQPYQSYLVMTSIFDKSYLFCLLFLSASYYACAQKAELAKPNVIVILTDDQGSIDLNSYGAKDLYTPNMDRLAKEGVRFTQFYAGAPVCSPSRAALLTGKTNLRAGLPNNVPIPEKAEATGQYGLPTEEITMAEMLKDNGYRTALIGKWHLGHRPQNLPNGQGFDYFFGHQRGCIDNYSHFFLSGSVENFDGFFAAGDSRLEARDLVVQHYDLLHRGTNKLIVNPQQSLKADLFSYGDIISVNRPPEVNVTEHFEGRLIFE